MSGRISAIADALPAQFAVVLLIPKMLPRAPALVLILASLLGAAEPKKQNGPTFASPTPLPAALRGLVYRLPRITDYIPNFATYKPVGGLCTGRYVMSGGSNRQLRDALFLGPLPFDGRSEGGNLLAKPNQSDLLVLRDLVEVGKLRPVIERR